MKKGTIMTTEQLASRKKIVRKANRDEQTDTSRNFLDKEEIYKEVMACKANNNTVSTDLGIMLQMMCEKYKYKRNWAGYSYKDDMARYALVNLLNNWHKFDGERFKNAFAYYTTAIYRCFLQYHANESDQRNMRDQMLVREGWEPSWSYVDKTRRVREHEKPSECVVIKFKNGVRVTVEDENKIIYEKDLMPHHLLEEETEHEYVDTGVDTERSTR